MPTYLFQNINDFFLNSLQNFPFTMFVCFAIFGVIFSQPTWSLLSAGLFLCYILTAVLQLILGKVASLIPGMSELVNTNTENISVCYPYSTTAKGFTFPSQWITQTSFLFSFIIHNSVQLAGKAGNKNLFEAYQRRLSRTQISILACICLLLIFVGLRIQSECDTPLNAIISVLLGAGIGVAYWQILDICNTQLHSDILGITRNMAPPNDNDEVSVVCTA
jgi:hypothetical protein